jgi:hypothetical protein
VHGDEPTIPNLRTYGGDGPEGAPGWPLASRRPPQSSPNADLRTALLGLSLGANVVLLVSLVGALLLARAGFFAPGGSAAQPPSGISASTQTSGTPSPAQSTASPRTVGDWLQVSPTSVSLGCDNGQQTQFVVLANQGPEPVEWQADLSGSQDQAGVSLSPTHGQLRAGASIALRVQNRSHNDGQGTIRFEVSPQDAGSPPTLNYTTQGCD